MTRFAHCWCRSFCWGIAMEALTRPTISVFSDLGSFEGVLTGVEMRGTVEEGHPVHKFLPGHSHLLYDVVINGHRRIPADTIHDLLGPEGFALPEEPSAVPGTA